MSAVFPPSPEPGGRRAQGFLTASVVLASVALVGGTGTALTLTDNRRAASATASLARAAASGTPAPLAVPPHAPSRTAGEPPWAPDSTGAASNPASLGPHHSSTAAPSARTAKRVAASASPASHPANSAANPTDSAGPTASASSVASPAAPATSTSSMDLSPQEHCPQEHPRDATSRRSPAGCRRDHQDLVSRPDAGDRPTLRQSEDLRGAARSSAASGSAARQSGAAGAANSGSSASSVATGAVKNAGAYGVNVAQ
jgi:hypothetical protein